MSNQYLSTKLKKLENDINGMNNIDGIKKLVNTYNIIQKDIDICKEYLDEIIININSEAELSDKILTYEEYINNMKELETIKQNMNENLENIELEDLKNLYLQSTNMIKECQNYLENQKMQIENVD